VRRTTSWALGGMLAGTVLLGTGGTLATFSDTESLSATAGAGRLALADAPTVRSAQQPKAGWSALWPVQPEVVGSGTARLQLSAVAAPGGKPCDESIRLSVTLPSPAAPVEAGLCALTRTGVDLLPTVNSDTRDFTLSVSAFVPDGVDPSARTWDGDLRLTLVQAGGQGFSDEQLMPVHVVIPNPQNKSGTESGTGNGNGKGNGNGNGTGG
jgi:predicted ribosomally synthesized peptide with SipW-like signal peptide